MQKLIVYLLRKACKLFLIEKTNQKKLLNDFDKLKLLDLFNNNIKQNIKL